MMKINPLCSIVDGQGLHAPGVVFDIDELDGRALINQGYAFEVTVRVPIKVDKPPEKSVEKPPVKPIEKPIDVILENLSDKFKKKK